MGKWDGIKSRKIFDATQTFSQKLLDDLEPGATARLTHEIVVNIVSAAIEDGVLTPSELNDLRIVANNPEMMPARSFAMLRYLVEQTPKVVGAEGLFSLTTAGERVAADRICDFLKRTSNGFFAHLDRDRVGIDLLLRVGNPEIMNQKPAGLCGPLAFLYNLASDKPLDYVRFAVELYEKGSSKIGDMLIEPSNGCRIFSAPLHEAQRIGSRRLACAIPRTGGHSPQTVFLTVYTWGRGKFRIPQGGTLSEEELLERLVWLRRRQTVLTLRSRGRKGSAAHLARSGALTPLADLERSPNGTILSRPT
jgi:hypothetical protein